MCVLRVRVLQAYAAFWLIGGAIGLVAYAILALLVHPQEEPTPRSCQCTRHWYQKEHDERRRQREQLEKPLAQRKLVVRSSAARDEVNSMPIGALCCDRLLFGSDSHQRGVAAGSKRSHD